MSFPLTLRCFQRCFERRPGLASAVSSSLAVGACCERPNPSLFSKAVFKLLKQETLTHVPSCSFYRIRIGRAGPLLHLVFELVVLLS